MKKKKEKKEENPKILKIKTIIFIVLLVYIIINRVYSLFIINETSSDNLLESVTDEYEFVRVSECMSKYMKAINSQNTNDIINVYSEDYKKENNITTENVLSINNLSNIVCFKVEELYKDNTKYYAYVTFYSELDNSDIEKNSCEFTIRFYNNNTFAITPQIQEDINQGD